MADVFVAALQARVRYRPHSSGSALPWLYGISVNVVRAHLRERRPHAMVDVDAGVDWNAVDDRLDAAAARDELRRALEALTPGERATFLLVAWEGLTAEEAGQVLGVSAAVVRTRLSRARQRARSALADTPASAV